MSRARRVPAGLLLVALLLLVAGCGGGDSSSSSSSSATTATGGASTQTTATGGTATTPAAGGGNAAVTKATPIVEKAQSEAGTGAFPKPPGPVAAGTGKAVVINTGDICDVCKKNADLVVGVFKKIGWDVPAARDGKFQPSVISGWIQQAIKDKVDGIVLLTINASQSKPDIQQAYKAGIKVACVNCDISPDIKALGVTDAKIDFLEEGKQMGWWLIAHSQGKGKIFIADEPSRDPVVKRVKGAFDTVKAECPDCSVKKTTISVAETVKPGPPTWTSTLNASPKGTLTDAAAYFGGLAVPMVKTVESAGRTDVSVSGYDADVGAIELMKSGNTYVGDFAIPYPYQDWSAVDQLIRQIRGKPTWDAGSMPVRLITKKNVGSFTGSFGPTGDWQGEFLKLWGK